MHRVVEVFGIGTYDLDIPGNSSIWKLYYHEALSILYTKRTFSL